ncbi:hypothetical protein [Deinococcus arcticus]|uniref:hypothetical protein n=1 Tax=Deinococcus arcticus TaxID=2136176 RepID=UPI001E5BA2F1|nr:hypothetical protein [Deinococcus arcticus]
MEYARKPTSTRKAPEQAAERHSSAPLDLVLQRHAQLRADLTRFTSHAPALQRRQAAPALRALELHAGEVSRLDDQRQTLQRQLADLGPVRPDQADPTVQREASPDPPARPQNPADWVAVMQRHAGQVEGQRLDSRQFAQHAALQRQVAQTLAQGFRTDRGPAQARYDTYGEHLATLQRHELSAPVARVVLGLVPPGERLALQRAVVSCRGRASSRPTLIRCCAQPPCNGSWRN